MFEQFHARRPIHPLAAMLCSIGSMIVGMLCARTPLVFAYVAFLAVVFICAGLSTAVVYMSIGMGIFGIITGGITALLNATFEQFWISPARCLVIGVCVAPLLSVPPALLVRCLNQLRFPRTLTLGMLVTVRFVPIVYGEISQIRAAMRTRGVDTRLTWFAWYRPSNLYRAFLVPLIMRAVNISDTLSLSVETRGFDTEARQATVWRPVRFTPRDALFTGLVALACAGILVAARLFPEVTLP